MNLITRLAILYRNNMRYSFFILFSFISLTAFGQASQPPNSNSHKVMSSTYNVFVKLPAQPLDSFLCALSYEIVDRNAFIVLATQDSIGKKILLKDNSRIVFTLLDSSMLTTMPPATENTQHLKGLIPLCVGNHPESNYFYYVYTFKFPLSMNQLGILARTGIKFGRLYTTESQYIDIRGIPSDWMKGSAAAVLDLYNKHFGIR